MSGRLLCHSASPHGQFLKNISLIFPFLKHFIAAFVCSYVYFSKILKLTWKVNINSIPVFIHCQTRVNEILLGLFFNICFGKVNDIIYPSDPTTISTPLPGRGRSSAFTLASTLPGICPSDNFLWDFSDPLCSFASLTM